MSRYNVSDITRKVKALVRRFKRPPSFLDDKQDLRKLVKALRGGKGNGRLDK